MKARGPVPLAVRLGAALVAGALLGGCGDGPPAGPPLPPAPAWTPERSAAAEALATRLLALPEASPGEIRVHLAFGPEVDLDVYVTGPLEETVYYANTPSGIGGELLEDRRCAHEGVRIETVRFPLHSGPYRVGVDYPLACGEVEKPAPFALLVDTPGGRDGLRGLAVHQVFEPVVLEFDLEPGTDPEVTR